MFDFAHAFLVVFRIQCGEWIQNMWNCMDSVKQGGNTAMVPVCVLIFLGVVFVGNLVVSHVAMPTTFRSFKLRRVQPGGKVKFEKSKAPSAPSFPPTIAPAHTHF